MLKVSSSVCSCILWGSENHRVYICAVHTPGRRGCEMSPRSAAHVPRQEVKLTEGQGGSELTSLGSVCMLPCVPTHLGSSFITRTDILILCYFFGSLDLYCPCISFCLLLPLRLHHITILKPSAQSQ